MLDVIIFNGPPQCGKDTAKRLIMERFDTVEELRFASPLKRAVHELLCLPEVDEEAYAHLKDVESREAMGLKMRDLYIALSEEFTKVQFDKAIFGKLWMRNYHKLLKKHVAVVDDSIGIQYYPIVVVADCGFEVELRPLVDYFGASSMCIIQIHRPTCDYSNDSRGYIRPKEVPVYSLTNYVNDLVGFERNLFALLEEIGVLKDL